MSCQCEIYEICPQCAPSQKAFLKAVRDHDEVVNRRQPELSPPSYTLAELRELSKEYLATSQLTDTLAPELILSSLLAWLGKKEREGNERDRFNSS